MNPLMNPRRQFHGAALLIDSWTTGFVISDRSNLGHELKQRELAPEEKE
jgi:hypothetical protein